MLEFQILEINLQNFDFRICTCTSEKLCTHYHRGQNRFGNAKAFKLKEYYCENLLDYF